MSIPIPKETSLLPAKILENGVEIFVSETVRSKHDVLPLKPRHIIEVNQNKGVLLTGIESTNADLPDIVAAEIEEPFNQVHIFINHRNINPSLEVKDYTDIFKSSAQLIGLDMENISLAMHRFPEQDEIDAVEKMQQALRL